MGSQREKGMMKASSHLGKFLSTQAQWPGGPYDSFSHLCLVRRPVSGQSTNGQPPTITSMTPNPVMRGGIVTVKGNNFPVDPSKMTAY